jgi:hypothetical protein
MIQSRPLDAVSRSARSQSDSKEIFNPEYGRKAIAQKVFFAFRK